MGIAETFDAPAETCTVNCVGGAGLGIGGAVSTVGSYAAAVVADAVGTLLVLADATACRGT